MAKLPPEVLSDDEVLALIRACSNRAPTGVRNRALIAVLWRCGLRISEALALTTGDIDLVEGTLRVRHGKGDKARVVGLDETTVALLARWVDRKPSGLLFCTLQGGPVSTSYVRHLLRRLAKKAGVERRVHPHGLRHSYAAGLSRELTPVPVIRDALGHSSVATTDRYLRGIEPREVVDAMRAREWSL